MFCLILTLSVLVPIQWHLWFCPCQAWSLPLEIYTWWNRTLIYEMFKCKPLATNTFESRKQLFFGVGGIILNCGWREKHTTAISKGKMTVSYKMKYTQIAQHFCPSLVTQVNRTLISIFCRQMSIAVLFIIVQTWV